MTLVCRNGRRDSFTIRARIVDAGEGIANGTVGDAKRALILAALQARP